MKKIIGLALAFAVLCGSVWGQTIPAGRSLLPIVFANTENAYGISEIEAVAYTDFSKNTYRLVNMDLKKNLYVIFCTGMTKGLVGKMGQSAYKYMLNLSAENGKIIATIGDVTTSPIDLLTGKPTTWKSGGIVVKKTQTEIAKEFAEFANCSDEEYAAMVKKVMADSDMVPMIPFDDLIAMAEKDTSLYSNALVLGRCYNEKNELWADAKVEKNGVIGSNFDMPLKFNSVTSSKREGYKYESTFFIHTKNSLGVSGTIYMIYYYSNNAALIDATKNDIIDVKGKIAEINKDLTKKFKGLVVTE